MGGLWADPSGRAVAKNGPDQVFFEWVLSYTAHAITHGTNPWFTPLMNAPLGVDVAANTAVTLIGVVLTPVTLLFGASASFVVALTLNLSATGYAWYWMFSRHVTRARSAAILGGAFCGFAPGLISHANGHLNFTAQFLIPLLLWRLTLLARASRRAFVRRDGTVLGLLVAAQYAIGAEMLFFTALAAGIFAIAWAVQRRATAWRVARRAAPPLGIAALVAAALLAYPMWMQFFGPQAYDGTGFGNIGTASDLLSFGAFPYLSIGGALGGWTRLTVNVAEENSFFGPALLIGSMWCALRLCRRRGVPFVAGGRDFVEVRREEVTHRLMGLIAIRALCATAVVIAVCSLGSPLWIGHWKSHIPMPWGLVDRLPVFDAALPGRFALLLTPIVGVLIAVTLDTVVHRSPRRLGPIIAVGVVALVPILPLPVPTVPRAPLPLFFTSGDWRGYVVPGRSVMPVPPATATAPDGQRWQTATNFAFAIPGGYFLGPGRDGHSTIGAVPRATDAILDGVAATGVVPTITDTDRTQARADLAFWDTGVIVLPDESIGSGDDWSANHDALYQVCDELFGPGRRVDDVWLWPRSGG
jgi:hypothetical protein